MNQNIEQRLRRVEQAKVMVFEMFPELPEDSAENLARILEKTFYEQQRTKLDEDVKKL